MWSTHLWRQRHIITFTLFVWHWTVSSHPFLVNNSDTELSVLWESDWLYTSKVQTWNKTVKTTNTHRYIAGSVLQCWLKVVIKSINIRFSDSKFPVNMEEFTYQMYLHCVPKSVPRNSWWYVVTLSNLNQFFNILQPLERELTALFPGKPGWAGALTKVRLTGTTTGFVRVGCPSCHSTYTMSKQ